MKKENGFTLVEIIIGIAILLIIVVGAFIIIKNNNAKNEGEEAPKGEVEKEPTDIAGNDSNKCNYNGKLVQGAEFVDGQYTYRYMQKFGSNDWENIATDGWGVKLTDKNSTDPVTTKLCSSINGKPVTSMSYMFYGSQATSIDLSNFNTSNVTDMDNMFTDSQATTLDLSSFDTSNVTDMDIMFEDSKATTGYARKKADADKFNATENKPSRLNFVVK